LSWDRPIGACSNNTRDGRVLILGSFDSGWIRGLRQGIDGGKDLRGNGKKSGWRKQGGAAVPQGVEQRGGKNANEKKDKKTAYKRSLAGRGGRD